MAFVKIKPGESQNRVQYGDILFTLSSETPEEVGMGAVYLGNDKDVFLNSFSFGIQVYMSVCSREYEVQSAKTGFRECENGLSGYRCPKKNLHYIICNHGQD